MRPKRFPVITLLVLQSRPNGPLYFYIEIHKPPPFTTPKICLDRERGDRDTRARASDNFTDFYGKKKHCREVTRSISGPNVAPSSARLRIRVRIRTKMMRCYIMSSLYFQSAYNRRELKN